MKRSNAVPAGPDLSVSLIIPTYNRPAYVMDALRSVRTQTVPSTQYESLVVDTGPAAEARSPVDALDKSELPIVRYVREPDVGLHNGRHAGAREASGDILVYVDDDVLVHPGWLAAMLAPFADSRVACVGGTVLPKWEEISPPYWLSDLDRSYLSLLDLGDRPLTLNWPQTIHGCNMAIRRSVLYDVGGFNPDGFGDPRLIWLRGDGEVGLLKKMFRAGYKIVYAPDAWVFHRIPASRLTPEHFYWRAFIEGISDSYSRIRQSPSRAGMLLHGGQCFLESVRCFSDSVKSRDDRIKVRCRAWYWYGRGQHQLRAAVNIALYRHVLQPTYLH